MLKTISFHSITFNLFQSFKFAALSEKRTWSGKFGFGISQIWKEMQRERFESPAAANPINSFSLIHQTSFINCLCLLVLNELALNLQIWFVGVEWFEFPAPNHPSNQLNQIKLQMAPIIQLNMKKEWENSGCWWNWNLGIGFNWITVLKEWMQQPPWKGKRISLN